MMDRKASEDASVCVNVEQRNLAEVVVASEAEGQNNEKSKREIGTCRKILSVQSVDLECDDPSSQRTCPFDGKAEAFGAASSNGRLTMEEAIDTAGFGWFQIKLVLITGFCISADAMELMMLSFLGPAAKCEWGLSTSQVSLLTTVVFLGMLFGTYFWGAIADRYGRLKSLFYALILVFVFAILSAASINYYMLLFCRLLVGFGLGGCGMAWLYFLEFIPTKLRGRWACIMSVWWSLGTVLEAGLAWYLLPTLGWRWLLAISASPLILVFLGMLTLPESPRYYIVVGKPEKAQRVLQRVALENHSVIPTGTLVGSMNTALNNAVQDPIQALRIILNRTWRKLTLNLWVLWFANAFCYYGLVLLTTVLRTETNNEDHCGNGVLSDKDYVDVFIATAAELPGLAVAVATVDRLGRRQTQALLFMGTAFFILLLIPLNSSQDTAMVVMLFFGRMLISGAFTVTCK
mmetsp:Transcript_10641/g.20851  ORF Transcript_10641/g.20851 Transcript_10641/m.20851 type:complete len:462 (-) Transcript_10641:26-1411(-)